MDDNQYVINERQIPVRAIEVLQEVLDYGRAHGKSGWFGMSHKEHVDHLIRHIIDFCDIRDGNITDNEESAVDHLSHAFCRMMMLYITYCKENNLHGVK
jgi:hypothetical protein